jgi:non-heme chloroperoxidase
VSGWSYAPLVILDYIRHYGDERLAAIQFVGGVTKLGSDEAMAILTPEFLSLVPGFCSADVQESLRSLTALLRLCFAREPSIADLYLMLGYNLSVPPYVRQALFARSADNDDLFPTIRKPVLITHGARDAIVRPVAVEQYKSTLPHAQVHVMPDAGHAAFWDDAAVFNERLGAFAETLA